MKTLPLYAVAAILAVAPVGCNSSTTTRPQVDAYQGKGVNTGQIRTRSKAGESSYFAVRWVERNCEDGETPPCGNWSTAGIDSRKDSRLAGSFSGTIEITNQSTKIEIKGGEASTVGTEQIREQGLADRERLGGVRDIVETAGEAVNPRIGIIDAAREFVPDVITPPAP